MMGSHGALTHIFLTVTPFDWIPIDAYGGTLRTSHCGLAQQRETRVFQWNFYCSAERRVRVVGCLGSSPSCLWIVYSRDDQCSTSPRLPTQQPTLPPTLPPTQHGPAFQPWWCGDSSSWPLISIDTGPVIDGHPPPDHPTAPVSSGHLLAARLPERNAEDPDQVLPVCAVMWPTNNVVYQ